MINRLVFGNYLILLKKYWAGRISDEDLVNKLFDTILKDFDVYKKNNEPYEINKKRASALVNKRLNIPDIIIKYANKEGIKEKCHELFKKQIEKNIITDKKTELIEELLNLTKNDETITLSERNKLNNYYQKGNNTVFLVEVFYFVIHRKNKIDSQKELENSKKEEIKTVSDNISITEFKAQIPEDYIYSHLCFSDEWKHTETLEYNRFYNKKFPQYTIEIIDDDDGLEKTCFYAQVMTDTRVKNYKVVVMANGTPLDEFDAVCLDGYRFFTLSPQIGLIRCEHPSKEYFYRYFVIGSKEYLLTKFLYAHPFSEEAAADLISFNDIIIYYRDEYEIERFENYIKNNQDLLEKRIKKFKKLYNYVEAKNDYEAEYFKKALKTGAALKEILEKLKSYEKNYKKIED